MLHAGAFGLAMWQFGQPVMTGAEVQTSIRASVRSETTPRPQPEQQRKDAAWPETTQAASSSVARPTEIMLPPEQPRAAPVAPRPLRTSGSLDQPARNLPVGSFPRPAASKPSTTPPPPAARQPVETVATGSAGNVRTSGPVLPVSSPHIPPQLLEPKWPRRVRERFTGRVVVEVVVGLDGKAREARVVEGTGHDAWDEDLLKVFRKARYSVGMHLNQPVVSRHRFRVTFRRG